MNLGLFRALALALTLAATAAAHAEECHHDVRRSRNGVVHFRQHPIHAHFRHVCLPRVPPSVLRTSARVRSLTFPLPRLPTPPPRASPSRLLYPSADMFRSISTGTLLPEADRPRSSRRASITSTTPTFILMECSTGHTQLQLPRFPSAPLPNRSSFLLLGTGLFAVGGAFRRRLAQ